MDFNVRDGSVKSEQGESFPGGVVGLHVNNLLQTLKGKGKSIIDYFMNNEAWRSEKRVLAGDRRSSSRLSDSKSQISASSLSLKPQIIHHSLKYCSEKYEGDSCEGRTFSKPCVVCKGREAQPPDPPLRVSWHCMECSAGCVRLKDRVFIHPQCFGEYHNTFDVPSRAIQSDLSYC